MMRRLTLLLLTVAALAPADESIGIALRGATQTLARINVAQKTGVAVVFLPGDGGWRWTAVDMARKIATWGYEVYGFDTKRYLETCSVSGVELSTQGLASDMRSLAEQVGGLSRKPVVFVGWSEGAGMAVAAASGNKQNIPIKGVVTLGLPESAVLAWDWKSTLAIVVRRDPGQPAFAVKPLLPDIAPTPLWMIRGSQDEYTTEGKSRELFRAAGEPKSLREIAGANHRFDGHREELYRSIKEGLEWIAAN